MPEIDKDLFQLLNLALLGLGVLLLLALLLGLSSIRKLLKQQLEHTQNLANAASAPSALQVPPHQEEPSEAPLLPSSPVEERPPAIATPEPSHYGIDDFDNRPLLGGAAAADRDPSDELRALGADGPRSEAPPDEAAATSSPRDTEDQDQFASQYDSARAASTDAGDERPAADPFTAEPASASVGSGAERSDTDDDPFGAGGGSTTADPFAAGAGTGPAESTVDPASKMDDPFLSEAAGDDNPFMRDAGEQAPQSTLDEPEDQPFERNGRWFFKRDGELLVYEEGTGEWVPADPAGAPPPSQAPPPTAAHDTATGGEPPSEAASFGAPTDTAELDAVDAGESPARATGAGGFWKCPSCGAVNGSSADTCRMCFSARP